MKDMRIHTHDGPCIRNCGLLRDHVMRRLNRLIIRLPGWADGWSLGGGGGGVPEKRIGWSFLIWSERLAWRIGNQSGKTVWRG